MTQSLYGRRIRQPIGGDFGFTGSLARIYSHMDVWRTDIAKFGIDVWMTTTAIAEGFRICQSAMGIKVHDIKDPGSDLGSMFTQVAGTIFALMGEYEVKWQAVKASTPIRVFGEIGPQEPAHMEINVENLLDHFEVGAREYRDLWGEILPADDSRLLARMAADPANGLDYPVEFWMRNVYDFAVRYNFPRSLARQDIVSALVPLYCARTASFAAETRNMSSREAEGFVSRNAGVFEQGKGYLLEHWKRARERAERPPS